MLLHNPYPPTAPCVAPYVPPARRVAIATSQATMLLGLLLVALAHAWIMLTVGSVLTGIASAITLVTNVRTHSRVTQNM